MIKSGIYNIRNIVNNKSYIGSSVNLTARKNEHFRDLRNNFHHSIKLQRSFNKYGEKNFVFEIVEKCNKKKLIHREQYWIDYFDSYKKGYNCKPLAESSLGFKHSKQSIEKMKTFQKGRKKSKSHCKNISKARLGVRLSFTTRKKMSKSKMNHLPSKRTINKIIAKTSYPLLVILKSGKRKKYKSLAACSRQLKINVGDISRCINRISLHYKGHIFNLIKT